MIPDNRVAFIKEFHAATNDPDSKKKPAVRFRVAADSEQLFDGEIRKFDYRVKKSPEDAQSYSRALVDIDETKLAENLRLGVRVIAKIDCGERSNFFLLTYELKDKIREWFFY
jgi:hypothetical protein